MCGITGIVSLNQSPINIQNVKRMCDIISHRGPDDAGYFLANDGRYNSQQKIEKIFTDTSFQQISPELDLIDSKLGIEELNSKKWNIFFGHRRLSIIDITSAGHQPMTDSSGRIWIVYNGEIYNFKELRHDLVALGYKFKSNSDTEVIIYSYLQWGINCISKFNGMFAFTLWDKKNNSIFLCRDRYGVKPLYYTVTEKNHLIFASEVKSILQYPDYHISIDHEALYEYFTFQNIFTHKTLYKNISLLPAGNYLQISLERNNSNIEQKQYWDFHFEEPENQKSEKYYLETTNELFQQAIKRQLVSDVEIGSYLSGGLDSGAVTAVAAKHINYLKTFTVGFDLSSASGMELSFDEREKSEYMSYLFKTEHYEMVLKSGDMERCLPDFSWHLEEPRVGQSYPNYYAAKLASKFCKVVLAGTGGDELFAGYPWRYYRAVVNTDFDDYIDKYYLFWQRLIPNTKLKEVFSPIWDQVKHVRTREIFKNVFKSHSDNLTRPEDYINHSLYFEAKTFLHGLFVVDDKLSMAHSLETRVPFMDNDLVDFAMKVPAHFKLANLNNVVKQNENEVGNKINQYYKKTKDGKLLLRKALAKYIPESVTSREKQGFSAPDASWFKGESMDYVVSLLKSNSSQIYAHLNEEAIIPLIDEHLSGNVNRRLLIWSLLNFENWLKKYVAK